jgi:hypothetical protein
MMRLNPIPHSNLFATRTLEEVQADIECLPAKERALVYSFVMATLNACHHAVEKQQLLENYVDNMMV